jgi:hypothetical protein
VRLQEHEKRAHEQRVRATAQRILQRHIIAAADETFRWTTSIDLSEADLTEAFFSGADLTGADLWRANLTEAFLREANLTQADLRRATLTGAKLGGVSWTEGTVWPENLRDTIKRRRRRTSQAATSVFGMGTRYHSRRLRDLHRRQHENGHSRSS